MTKRQTLTMAPPGSWWVGERGAHYAAVDAARVTADESCELDGDQVVVECSPQAAEAAAAPGPHRVLELEPVGPVVSVGAGCFRAPTWVGIRVVTPTEVFGRHGEHVNWLINTLDADRGLTGQDAREAAHCLLEAICAERPVLRISDAQRARLRPSDQALVEQLERPATRPGQAFETIDMGLRIEARANRVEHHLRAAQAAVRRSHNVAPALDGDRYASAEDARRMVEAMVGWALLRGDELSPFDAAIDLIRSGRVPAFDDNRLTCIRSRGAGSGRWLQAVRENSELSGPPVAAVAGADAAWQPVPAARR